MIKIGMTGSIGSGKSTLAKHAAAELSIPIFDADAVVHDLYANDKALIEFVSQKCGTDHLDRQVLKAMMDDPNQRDAWKEIEKEVHRNVWARFESFTQEKELAGCKYIIADIPFLFEGGEDKNFDYSVNVYLPYEDQKRRALERAQPKLSEKDFEKRYATFMPIDKRNRKADFTVNNSGEIAASFLQLRSHIAKMGNLTTPSNVPNTFNQAATYVGSFDPMTLGHLDVVKSAVKMPYKKLYIAIGVNPSKNPMFTTEERLSMIERELDRDIRPHLAPGQKVIVTSYEGLTVNFMQSVGSSLCVRGLRGIKDLDDEGDLAAVNRGLYADSSQQSAEECFSQAYFVTTNPELRHVSSSFARALCAEEKDLSLLRYVSPDVAAKMISKRDKIPS